MSDNPAGREALLHLQSACDAADYGQWGQAAADAARAAELLQRAERHLENALVEEEEQAGGCQHGE